MGVFWACIRIRRPPTSSHTASLREIDRSKYPVPRARGHVHSDPLNVISKVKTHIQSYRHRPSSTEVDKQPFVQTTFERRTPDGFLRALQSSSPAHDGARKTWVCPCLRQGNDLQEDPWDKAECPNELDVEGSAWNSV